jgi:hypothetical protein
MAIFPVGLAVRIKYQRFPYQNTVSSNGTGFSLKFFRKSIMNPSDAPKHIAPVSHHSAK